jgi:hypothetical protein
LKNRSFGASVNNRYQFLFGFLFRRDVRCLSAAGHRGAARVDAPLPLDIVLRFDQQLCRQVMFCSWFIFLVFL